MTAAPERRLIAFFPLTFLVTWLAWLACARWGSRLPLLFGLGGPIFLLGVFAPALVAIGPHRMGTTAARASCGCCPGSGDGRWTRGSTCSR